MNPLGDAAKVAANRAGVEIRLLSGYRETAMAAEVFSQVWGRNATHVPTELGVAFIESGNYVAGAFSGKTMVGATVGFLGSHGGALHLHSHITGVIAEAQGSHIGTALKLHQAVWAEGQGLTHIAWSFDPLVKTNAHFNINRLGAMPVSYRRNLYGPLEDQFSAMAESDRLLVDWYPTGPKATAVRTGQHVPPDARTLLNAGAAEVLRDLDGPVASESLAADTLCIELPTDIVTLRTTSRSLAEAWRDAIRATLETALHEGFAVTGFDPTGWYILERTSQ